jgi:hypothetical protein
MNETKSDAIERRIDKSVSADTAISTTGSMAFRNVAQIMEFAKVMAVAGVAIPKHLRDTPGACMAVCIQAAEWQMSPFAVANKSYSVNDWLGYEAQLVNAVILRRAPIMGRFKATYSGADKTRKCKVMAKLNDGSGEEVEYESPEIDKIPVKNSPLWKGDPDQQLFYYSSRAMCRRHFPDVILGIYTQDELEESPPMERNVTPVPKARVPELLPEKAREAAPGEVDAHMKQEHATSARGAVERLAKAGGVEMGDVIAAANALEIINDVGKSIDEYGPATWAQIESRWTEVLTEAQQR